MWISGMRHRRDHRRSIHALRKRVLYLQWRWLHLMTPHTLGRIASLHSYCIAWEDLYQFIEHTQYEEHIPSGHDGLRGELSFRLAWESSCSHGECAVYLQESVENTMRDQYATYAKILAIRGWYPESEPWENHDDPEHSYQKFWHWVWVQYREF